MRMWFLPLALLGLTPGLVAAFPDQEVSGKPEKRCPFAHGKENSALNRHAKAAPIDVSGEHAFKPPGKGDQRGPCVALNALANHGYIPRNGVPTFGQAIKAVNEVFGMGTDFATLLATVSAVGVGDGRRFSIGGESPEVTKLPLGLLDGIVGKPGGLTGSHNFVESDASNTRGDLYLTGNNNALNMSIFEEWYSMAEDGEITFDTMGQWAATRFHQSVATNPNFWHGPISGVMGRTATFMINSRLMSNHTEEHPDGILTKEIIRDMYAIEGEGPNFTYREGWERIPENWYRSRDEWTFAKVLLDLTDLASKHPELASIGGNTGEVNSFTGINLADLTGGILNSTNLLEGNNLLCLGFSVLQTAVTTNILDVVTNALGGVLQNLACPQFKELKMDGEPYLKAAQKTYTGVKKSGGLAL